MKEVIKKYEEIIRYIIVGGMTTVVSFIVFYGSTWTFLDGNDAIQLQIANILQWVVSVIFAYGMNRKHVFKSENTQVGKEFVAFVSSRVATLLLDMAVMFVGATWLQMNYNFVKLISAVLVTVANYVLGKLMVFRKK